MVGGGGNGGLGRRMRRMREGKSDDCGLGFGESEFLLLNVSKDSRRVSRLGS